MDAIEYLTDQHREIESLFDQYESALRAKTKARLRRKLVDLLAVHMAIEERLFYPAAAHAGGGELLPRALVEHLSAECVIAALVQGHEGNDACPAMSVLKERQKQHADGEEKELFPAARKLLTPAQLAILGERMATLADQLLEPGVGARERVTARRAHA